MTCPHCHQQHDPSDEFCAHCGKAIRVQVLPPQSPPTLIRKNPFIATMLSFFFPAGGQIYNGDFKKMATIWFGCVTCVVIGFTLVGIGFAFLIGLPLWGWAIFDAYGVAKGERTLW